MVAVELVPWSTVVVVEEDQNVVVVEEEDQNVQLRARRLQHYNSPARSTGKQQHTSSAKKDAETELHYLHRNLSMNTFI